MAAKARKGLGSFGGIANGDSLTAKASWGFGVTFPKREARNRDEYIYIYLLRKNEEVQTFAGFLWIKKTYLSKLYNHMYTYIYIILLSQRRGWSLLLIWTVCQNTYILGVFASYDASG